jgi:hypothetical protein
VQTQHTLTQKPEAGEDLEKKQEPEPNPGSVPTLSTQIKQIQQELTMLKNQKANVLQVICVTSDDNYLDMLTQKIGNFEQAVEYLKDCALSDVSGDCRLIERIYLDTKSHQYGFSINGNRNQIVYYNEHQEQITEPRETFGKKIANNLQKTYLRGINHLITRNLTNRMNPNKFLEEYDMATWNDHIYHLSDSGYQKQLLNQLNIPCQ